MEGSHKKNSLKSKVTSFIGSSSDYSGSLEERRSKGSYFEIQKRKRHIDDTDQTLSKKKLENIEESEQDPTPWWRCT
jgi:hypothetical protein